MSNTEAGLIRCEVLKEIRSEIHQLNSLPDNEKQALLWAINNLLIRYRCELKNQVLH